MHPEEKELQAGIVSFRALKEGFIPAGFKEGRSPAVSQLDTVLLTDFEDEFKNLLIEIFNESIPFEHRDRTEPCRFCDPEEFR